jgi:hypothetical protein
MASASSRHHASHHHCECNVFLIIIDRPNVIAFNFASTTIQALILLLIFMAITFGLLVYFYRSTQYCDRYTSVEGLQRSSPLGKQWMLILSTFLLNVLYLPLSIMAIHVLVWSDDLWVVDNPYKNATNFPPYIPPLGPASQFRDPLDFCWTTTMKRNEINFSPVVIVVSVIVVVGVGGFQLLMTACSSDCSSSRYGFL